MQQMARAVYDLVERLPKHPTTGETTNVTSKTTEQHEKETLRETGDAHRQVTTTDAAAASKCYGRERYVGRGRRHIIWRTEL